MVRGSHIRKYNKIIKNHLSGIAFLCNYEKNKFDVEGVVTAIIPDSVPQSEIDAVNRAEREAADAVEPGTAPENGDDAKTILEDNIHTIRKLGLNVVQEGVETRAQLDEIVSLGGNLIQGFFFSKPLPEEEFITYVKEFKGKDKV